MPNGSSMGVTTVERLCALFSSIFGRLWFDIADREPTKMNYNLYVLSAADLLFPTAPYLFESENGNPMN